jgi:DNA polymerase-1
MGNGIEIWGVPEVLEKFEIERPDQINWFSAWWAMLRIISQDFPVGAVTAKKFLKVGDNGKPLANTDESWRKEENVEANKERAFV